MSILDLFDGNRDHEKEAQRIAATLADTLLDRLGKALAQVRDGNRVVITIAVEKEGE